LLSFNILLGDEEHVLLVNGLGDNPIPNLQTPFRLVTSSLTVLMHVRIHKFKEDNGVLFKLIG